MKTYQSHKLVEAAQINQAPFHSVTRGGWIIPVQGDVEHVVTEEIYQRIAAMAEQSEQRHLPGGYLVQYEDGYISWSPATAFENGYTEAVRETEDDVESFGFATVIDGLKRGQRYRRLGWNGKGMFIFMVPGSEFQVNRPPLLGIFDEGTPIQYRGHIDMRMADGSISVWTAAQPDLLGQDWVEA